MIMKYNYCNDDNNNNTNNKNNSDINNDNNSNIYNEEPVFHNRYNVTYLGDACQQYVDEASASFRVCRNCNGGAKVKKKNTVTLVTHTSTDRLDRLELMINNWQGKRNF